MPNRQYAYQYDTNPRKLKPDYTLPRKNQKQYSKSKEKTNMKKRTKNDNLSEKNKNTKEKMQDAKNQKKMIIKTKISISIKAILIFAVLFFIIFRNSQISEAFSKIQTLKNQIATIEKENDQLEINIQNSVNLQTIEQAAKEKLGMQKLTSKQTVQINLPKKDYTEPRTEQVIIEQNQNWFDKIIEKIKNIF